MQLTLEHLLDAPVGACPVTFIDLETTGLSPRFGDRICEVAAVRYHGPNEEARLCTLVDPGRAISPAAMAVNGITADMLAGAPSFATIAQDLLAMLEDGAIVAHNAPFDLSFLSRELTMAGYPVPVHLPVIDTLAIARRRFSFPSNSLGRIAASLDIGSVAHRALSDALTTRAVLRHFITELSDGNDLRLRGLLSLQGGSVAWPVAKEAADLPVPPDLAEVLGIGCRLRLTYVSAHGAASERLVDPIEVVARGDIIYLVAYCHLRQQQRTFRLDRVIAWQPC